MNHQIEDSSQPRIVGFESQPIPTNGALDAKKYGLIGVGIALVIFLFVVPSSPSPGSVDKHKENKYVAPESNSPSYASAKEATEAVQQYVDQQMNKNQEMFDSLRSR